MSMAVRTPTFSPGGVTVNGVQPPVLGRFFEVSSARDDGLTGSVEEDLVLGDHLAGVLGSVLEGLGHVLSATRK